MTVYTACVHTHPAGQQTFGCWAVIQSHVISHSYILTLLLSITILYTMYMLSEWYTLLTSEHCSMWLRSTCDCVIHALVISNYVKALHVIDLYYKCTGDQHYVWLSWSGHLTDLYETSMWLTCVTHVQVISIMSNYFMWLNPPLHWSLLIFCTF